MDNPQDTILIIEGNSVQLDHLDRVLALAGFQTLTARRALDGLDLARNFAVDLILTSIDLPDLSGREMATTLRADNSFDLVPIVALIDHDSPEQRVLNLAAGITGFIQRPIDPEVLPVMLEFYLSGGSDAPDDSNRLHDARQRYVQDVVRRLEGRIRELERKNEELQRVDQMKDSFIQLTAHELRTPLTLVSGYTRLLEDHPAFRSLIGTDMDFRTLFDGLSESLERMHGIIEEVLITSRIMTSKIDLNINIVNLGEIVARVVHSFADALEMRHLMIHWDETDFPTEMMADGDLLRVTLSNLVSNAIKYTPDGGDIFITAQHMPSLVRIGVRDTGIGIAPELKEHIFERLQITQDVALHSTSKTAFGGGGLGLGLAICKGIVEAHGGQISVESPGHDKVNLPGSEFIILIPMRSASPRRTTGKLKRLKTDTPDLF